MGYKEKVILFAIIVLVFGVSYMFQDHYAEAGCGYSGRLDGPFVIPVGEEVEFTLRGITGDAFAEPVWDFYYSYDGSEYKQLWDDVPLNGASWSTQDLLFTYTFNNPGRHTMQFWCGGTNGDDNKDTLMFIVGDSDPVTDPPPDDNYDYTGIVAIGVSAMVGVIVAAAAKSASNKKSSTLNKTKEKVPYDYSKGYDIGFRPKLLRPAEPKTKTLWVEPPSPEVDNTLYDNADEIFTPNSALEFAEYVSKHWDRIQRTDWEKYFENVGNCIIEKGGALHTTEAWAKKVKEIQYGKALDLVEHNGISAGDLLDYSANDTVQTKDVKGYAKVVAWAIAEELFNKSVKVTKVNIMPLSVGETIKNMTPAPFKILQFLVDYFGENIMDSYSCLWASFKNLPVNRLPDKDWNGV